MSKAIHVIPEPLPTTSETRFAAYLLTDYLERLGVEVVFGLTGHTVIGLLDALGRSRIRYVSTRHEQVAAHAADGYARATGKPGVLLTHLGPGLTNAATGVANAALDSIPMVVIAGDVQSYFHGRHPHQEVNLHQDADQYQIYRPFCKRVYRVEHARDLPRDHRARVPPRADRTSRAGAGRRADGRLLDQPADRRLQQGAGRDRAARRSTRRRRSGSSRRSRRPNGPVLYAGGGVLSARASAELAALAEALELPIAHTLMGKGVVREDHPLLLGMTGFWGTPIANEKCRTADLILAIGTRLRRSELELLGSAVHLQHSADAADPHRRRRRGDRPQLPHRARRRRRREAGARRRWSTAAKGVKHRNRGSLRLEIAQGRRAFAANWADQYSSSQYPMRPERILSELRKAVPGRRLHRHRRRLEQERRRAAVPDHRAGHVHHAERTGDDGVRAGGGAGREAGAAGSRGRGAGRRRRVRQQPVGRRHRDGGGARRRVAGDGQRRVRHDRGPDEHALRLGVRLPVRSGRRALPHRLRADREGLRRRRRVHQVGRRARAGADARRSPPDGRR